MPGDWLERAKKAKLFRRFLQIFYKHFTPA